MTRSEYSGFDYQKASKEADRLLADAIKTGRWFDLPEKLIALRSIMNASASDKQSRLKFG